MSVSTSQAQSHVVDMVGLRRRLSERGIDGVTAMMLPAALFVAALFVYPFLYGLWLSFNPTASGTGALRNYVRFFSDPFLYDTIAKTIALAGPAALLNLALAVPIAMRVRRMRGQRVLAAILIVPITLGTVLVAEGMLNYLGPQGWVNRLLVTLHLTSGPIRLIHNYTGVFLSIVIAGFPFTFLLTLSYLTGIDPALEKAASTLGAGARQRFWTILVPLILSGLLITFCLSFVQAFSVFPSAVLLGAPAGPTRVISIAAYTAAYEEYDYSMASAIAMIMGFVQLGIVAVVLGLRRFFYQGATTGGKG